MPKLSVIVPVYKVEKYIHKCVDSILNQTFTDFELILVDDGSPDNCGRICDEYAKKDSRVRVIHQENGGLSAARNTGIQNAKAEFITFVDSDDYIDADMYEYMLQYMKANNLDLLCSDTKQVRGDKVKINYLFDGDMLFDHDEGLEDILVGKIDNAAWNKVYKTEIVKQHGYPERRIYEDVATTYKYFSHCERTGYARKAFYNYRKDNSGSIVANSFNSKARYDCFLGYKERYEYAVKNNLPYVNICADLAVSTGLSTLTAFYANGERQKSERYRDVVDTIAYLDKEFPIHVKGKGRLLWWSFHHCSLIHKIYAKISNWSKKIR